MSGTVAWGEEEKDKIKILSHESIIAECNKQHSDLLIMDVIYSLLVFAVTVAIEALLICNISNFVGNFEDGGFVFVIKLIVIILGVIMAMWPLTMMVLNWVETRILVSRINKGKYTVIDDIVVTSSPSEAYPISFWDRLRGKGSRYSYAYYYPTLYFSRSGQYPVSRGTYDSAQSGDRYFVVVMNGKKGEIYGVYSQKHYRWEGDPVPFRAES